MISDKSQFMEEIMKNTNQTIVSCGQDRNTLKQDNAPKMTVNDAEYTVIKLLGKGKGGYSYLVTDGAAQYVLKQIHHEPCEYYAFGDKLQSELRDYETLRKLGIPMPRLLAVDTPQERILKDSAYWYQQVMATNGENL